MKEYTFRFGAYGVHPNDAEPITVAFPDDTLFFTRGIDDYARFIHDGAIHITALTKASDAELDDFSERLSGMANLHIDVLKVSASIFDLHIFRIGGWAIIEITDCIPDDDLQVSTDMDLLNKTLNLSEHPVYIGMINGGNVKYKIIRLDKIVSFDVAIVQDVVTHGDLPGYYEEEMGAIATDISVNLTKILHPFREERVVVLSEEEGKLEFDEAVQKTLNIIYPKN